MKKMFLFLILVTVLITSCDEKKPPEEVKQVEQKEDFNLSKMPFIISNPWMRAGAQNRNSAAFMKITNNTDVNDTLFSVQSDLAKVTEIHETYEKGNDMMGMRHLDFLVIPSKLVVELKPGSFHIMFIGLKQDYGIGDSGNLTLEFKNSGKVQLPVTVGTVAKD